MNKDIAVCNKYQPDQHKELMISHGVLSRPWEKVSCDLFDFEDKHYLVCGGCYLDYFDVAESLIRKAR